MAFDRAAGEVHAKPLLRVARSAPAGAVTQAGAVGQAKAITPAPAPIAARPKRLPLARNRRRLSYDLRLRLWMALLGLPAVACLSLLAWQMSASVLLTFGVALGSSLLYLVLFSVLFEQLTRPLQTLSNVVAALREDDFAFRARGARRGDSLGDLALEINALAGTLQAQRGAARDALTLAERVMGAMRTPVLAFSADGCLRLVNPAAASVFGLLRSSGLGKSAATLGLEPLRTLADGAVHTHVTAAGESRWSVRRSSFRLGGVPHELFVLSDVDAALREEERVAWQRLVRVLSHEINNSLTPITSLAGSLRARLGEPQDSAASESTVPYAADLRRGLYLIEDRALSLHRFLQAYQQLSRLPAPTLQRVSLDDLLQRVVSLESGLVVQLLAGPPVSLFVDSAQIEQLLINLLRNAVEAAVSVTSGMHLPCVSVAWTASDAELVIRVEDNGPGLTDTANLFVPFYTTKPQGSGIGLALAQQIAAGHRGTLTLANRQDAEGCVAELRLPLSSGSVSEREV